jgi:Transposase, Mutator family
VIEHLPEADRDPVKRRLVKAWKETDHDTALEQLHRLAIELEREHPGAAASLREGMAETLTVTRLGITGKLKLTLQSTNPCESMISTVRVIQRNVKNWSSGEMCMRWTAAGMLEAETRFRKVEGYFPAAFSFSECAVINVASTSIVNRSGAPESSQNRSRAVACAERSAFSIPASNAIRATVRNAVESDATPPNSASCSRTAPRSDTHSPPSASITARSRITRPGSCPRRRCFRAARRADSARVSPSLSATCPSSALPACDTNPAPSAVTSTVTQRPSRITLKVTSKARDQGLQQSQESLLCRTFPRPRSPRGRGSYCRIRASTRGDPKAGLES